MATDSRRPGRVAQLSGRSSELGVLDGLVDAVRAGQSRVLVVGGEPGVGKTALLDYLAGRGAAAGCRVARAAGVQSEMELAFAGDGKYDPFTPPGDGALYRAHFTGKYAHHTLPVGHNVPQEDPRGFVRAVIEVDHL